MNILYTIIIGLYYFGIMLSAPFNRKAARMLTGRRGLFRFLRDGMAKKDAWIWFHCASLGEFEQGRPVMERLRKERPDTGILLTFFSPSGYEVRKNYAGADLVCYLPFDFPWNVKKFLSLVKPRMAVFVKYEFWHHYLKAMAHRGIPLYGISVIIRENHPFLKWYGRSYRKVLHCFDHLFVQDEDSKRRLARMGITRVSVAGDTRFDRVVEIARQAKKIEPVERFASGEKILVAGSTWPPDEEILLKYLHEEENPWKWIVAPHEIHEQHIRNILEHSRVQACRYSKAGETNPEKCRLLVIDNIGMLSSLYRYASLSYVGGGFGRGIHNVLEAAAYGIPVIFGPHYQAFREAVELIKRGGGFPVNNYSELKTRLNMLARQPETLARSSNAAGTFVHKSTGATEIIVGKLLNSY